MDRLLDLTKQAETDHFWFRGFRCFVTPVLAEIARGQPGLRLLDCGCGTGANLDLLAPLGANVGFDQSLGGLMWARKRQLRVAKADITAIPFPSARFDLVTAFDVLQCVPNDGSAVREMARVVRPGGRLVVTVAAFKLLRGDHGEVWREVRRYTPAGVRMLMEGAGLEVERVSFLFASIFPVVVAARLLQRLSRPFRGVRDDIDITVPPAPINVALTALVSAEERLSRILPMPFGSSLLVVARRPPT